MMRSACFLFLFGLLTSDLVAQAINPDSTILKNATQYALIRYQQSDRSNEQLYNGYEYVGYDPRLKGDPYFEVKDWKPGTIQIGARDFTAVPMLYDLVRDVVVVEHEAGYRMTLRSDKVTSFSFQNHQFARLSDSTNRDFRTGFYDVLYDGPTQLLAKRSKTSSINSMAGQGIGQFNAAVTYYVRKDGRYQPVKNKRMLLAVLADRKKELTSYARTKKIRYRPDPESAFVTLTRYYDELGK